MSVVTKTGDSGHTTGPNGRVSKSDQFVITVGTLDELQAHIGLVYELAKENNGIDRDLLYIIMGDIYKLQGDLYLGKSISQDTFATNYMDNKIKSMESEMPELKSFIKPVGSVFAAQIHIARTVCRRAERELVKYYTELGNTNISYDFLNRLSDYLFTLARFINL